MRGTRFRGGSHCRRARSPSQTPSSSEYPVGLSTMKCYLPHGRRLRPEWLICSLDLPVPALCDPETLPRACVGGPSATERLLLPAVGWPQRLRLAHAWPTLASPTALGLVPRRRLGGVLDEPEGCDRSLVRDAQPLSCHSRFKHRRNYKRGRCQCRYFVLQSVSEIPLDGSWSAPEA